MSFAAAVGLVARREIVERVRERSFWISTSIMGVIVVLVILKQFDFYNPQVLFLVSIAGVIGSAVLDARAVQRGRVGYFEG